MDLFKTKNNQSNGLLSSIIFIILFGFFLRLNAAINQSFWQDEVYILNVSRQHSVNQLLLLQQEDKAHPQLYYLLSNLIARYNTSPFVLRLPSLIAFIPAVVFIYLIGVVVFSRRTGILASFIFAVHPFFVNQGFQAKMYALTYFFVLGGLFFALRAVRDRKFRWSFLSGLFSAAAFYTDYSTVWYLLSLLSAWLISSLVWKEQRRSLLKSLSLTFMVTALFISVDLPLFLNYFGEAATGEYLGKDWYWYARGAIADFSGSWSLPAMIEAITPSLTVYLVWPIFLLSILIFLGCLKTLAGAINTASRITEKFFGVFLLSSFFVPVFSSYLFSILYSPIFNPANLWVSGLPFIFGMALLLIHNRSKILPMVFVLVYILTLAVVSTGRWGFFGATDWKGLTEQLLLRQGRKDVVFLDFEGSIWARTMSFVDYYLEVPPGNRLKKTVFLHQIDMNKPIDIKLVNKLSMADRLWLLSNADNADGRLAREKNNQIVKEFQSLLQCQKKPCRQVFVVKRD